MQQEEEEEEGGKLPFRAQSAQPNSGIHQYIAGTGNNQETVATFL